MMMTTQVTTEYLQKLDGSVKPQKIHTVPIYEGYALPHAILCAGSTRSLPIVRILSVIIYPSTPHTTVVSTQLLTQRYHCHPGCSTLACVRGGKPEAPMGDMNQAIVEDEVKATHGYHFEEWPDLRFQRAGDHQQPSSSCDGI